MSLILSETASAYPLRCKGNLIIAGPARVAARAIRRECMLLVVVWGFLYRIEVTDRGRKLGALVVDLLSRDFVG